MNLFIDPTAIGKPAFANGQAEQVGVPQRFRDALETISYSLKGDGSPDYGILFEFVPNPLSPTLIQRIIKAALSLDHLISVGHLPALNPSVHPEFNGTISFPGTRDLNESQLRSHLTFSHQQLISLLCHQILGALPKPEWMTWSGPNLSPSWFAEDERGDPRIKRAYIRVLLSFLQEVLPPIEGEEWQNEGETSVNFELLDLPRLPHDYEESHQVTDQVDSLFPLFGADPRDWDTLRSQTLLPLKITLLEEEDDDCPALFSLDSEAQSENIRTESDQTQSIDATTTSNTIVFCQLVSANKEIGFGSAGSSSSSPVFYPI
jgi:hypothetical protein